MKKILVIEDERDVRENLLDLLKAEGFEAIGAIDGEDGVRAAMETIPDLIICDILMPKLDGFGVLGRLRNDPVTALIPLIFLTARTDREFLRKGMGLGADDYIAKPFSRIEILQSIRGRFEKRKIVETTLKGQITESDHNLIKNMPFELLEPLTFILNQTDFLDSTQPSRLEDVLKSVKSIQFAAQKLHRIILDYIAINEINEIQQSSSDLQKTLSARILLAKVLPELIRESAAVERVTAKCEIAYGTEYSQISEQMLQKCIEIIFRYIGQMSIRDSEILINVFSTQEMVCSLTFSFQPNGKLLNEFKELAFNSFVPDYQKTISILGIEVILLQKILTIHNGDWQFLTPGPHKAEFVLSLPIAHES